MKKKLICITLALGAIFLNSDAYAVKTKEPCSSFTQAFQSVKNKSNFTILRTAKFDDLNKIYDITYFTKECGIETIKISQNGEEVE